MTGHPAIRHQVIERFTTEFGQPDVQDDHYQWSVSEPERAPIHLRMDSAATPNRVHVWVFDPYAGLNSCAECVPIQDQPELDKVVEKIKAQIHRAD